MSTITRTLAIVTACLVPAWAAAQPLGTFRWQLQPYCNVVTLSVTQESGAYRLTGTDDLCGQGTAASAVGTAFPNADGTIGFGLTIVPAPNGTPVHVGASIQLSTLSGTWRDSAGHNGSFVAAPGAGTGGDPRPTVPPGLSGLTIGYGLSRSGAPGNVSLDVDLQAIMSGLNLRLPERGSVALGSSALASALSGAFNNTAIGSGAMTATTTGDYNTALGYDALTTTTTGRGNTAMGAFALRANVDGEENTALGTSALERIVVSSGNTAIGSGALFRLQLGRNNIGIGQQAGFNLVAGSYNTYLGNLGVDLDNYTVRIGYNDSGSRAFIHGIRGRTTGVANAVPVVVDSTGQLGTVSSSRRFKEDIADLGEVASMVQQLHPVSFRYVQRFADGSSPIQYGLIAEEVKDVLPELVAYGSDGQPETVMYHVLPTLLVAEVQRLERERAALSSRLDALERELASVRQQRP